MNPKAPAACVRPGLFLHWVRTGCAGFSRLGWRGSQEPCPFFARSFKPAKPTAPGSPRENSLAEPVRPSYNPRAMTRKQIDVSVYVFLILLIGFFAKAVWGVLGMIGLHG